MEVRVLDAFGRLIRVEKVASSNDGIVQEEVFLLNVAAKIRRKYLSKELGIVIRNLHQDEIDICAKRLQEEILQVLQIDYEKIANFCEKYDNKRSELENALEFVMKDIYSKEEILGFYKYVYLKEILYGGLGTDADLLDENDFVDKEETSMKLALNFCANLIVVEVLDYQKLYRYFNSYFDLRGNFSHQSTHVEDFLSNFIELCNIVFLQNIGQVINGFRFKIASFLLCDFDVLSLINYFDNYAGSEYKNAILSTNLSLIKHNYLDSYLSGKREQVNNLIFICEKLKGYNKCFDDINITDLNLSLVSIIELLVVNSKGSKNQEITKKVIDNVLTCLLINKTLTGDYLKQKKIIAAIYRYRSCSSHGNPSNFKNALADLLELIEVDDYIGCYSINKNLERKVTGLLVFYIHNVFVMNSHNPLLLEHIKG